MLILSFLIQIQDTALLLQHPNLDLNFQHQHMCLSPVFHKQGQKHVREPYLAPAPPPEHPLAACPGSFPVSPRGESRAPENHRHLFLTVPKLSPLFDIGCSFITLLIWFSLSLSLLLFLCYSQFHFLSQELGLLPMEFFLPKRSFLSFTMLLSGRED